MEEQDLQKMATTIYLLKSEVDKMTEENKGFRSIIYGNGKAGIAENMRAVFDELKDINKKLDKKANVLPWKTIGIICGSILGIAGVFELLRGVIK